MSQMQHLVLELESLELYEPTFDHPNAILHFNIIINIKSFIIDGNIVFNEIEATFKDLYCNINK